MPNGEKRGYRETEVEKSKLLSLIKTWILDLEYQKAMPWQKNERLRNRGNILEILDESCQKVIAEAHVTMNKDDSEKIDSINSLIEYRETSSGGQERLGFNVNSGDLAVRTVSEKDEKKGSYSEFVYDNKGNPLKSEIGNPHNQETVYYGEGGGTGLKIIIDRKGNKTIIKDAQGQTIETRTDLPGRPGFGTQRLGSGGNPLSSDVPLPEDEFDKKFKEIYRKAFSLEEKE